MPGAAKAGVSHLPVCLVGKNLSRILMTIVFPACPPGGFTRTQQPADRYLPAQPRLRCAPALRVVSQPGSPLRSRGTAQFGESRGFWEAGSMEWLFAWVRGRKMQFSGKRTTLLRTVIQESHTLAGGREEALFCIPEQLMAMARDHVIGGIANHHRYPSADGEQTPWTAEILSNT